MTRSMILAGAAALLAACSPPASTTNANGATASAPAAAGGAATSIRPGQYRTTVTIVSMSIPGVPQSQLQAMQAQPQTDEDCVTSGDISDLARKSLIDADEGETCTDNHMNAANGRIEGAANCTNADGDTHSMHITGGYTPTHMDMDVTMTGQSAAGQMSQHIRMVTDRIGECVAH
ncbi:MAG TPA: DUF3617 family protein [Vitreimonas sp.]|jgi:hypothetical protein|nr:DUF3617 family protein [Vitreimonas sp.]